MLAQCLCVFWSGSCSSLTKMKLPCSMLWTSAEDLGLRRVFGYWHIDSVYPCKTLLLICVIKKKKLPFSAEILEDFVSDRTIYFLQIVNPFFRINYNNEGKIQVFHHLQVMKKHLCCMISLWKLWIFQMIFTWSWWLQGAEKIIFLIVL